jgi:hypothetical protein
MSQDNKVNVSVALVPFSFPSALFLLFLGLKLTGAISWSWWWVTAPLWVTGGTVLLIALFFLLAVLVVGEDD